MVYGSVEGLPAGGESVLGAWDGVGGVREGQRFVEIRDGAEWKGGVL